MSGGGRNLGKDGDGIRRCGGGVGSRRAATALCGVMVLGWSGAWAEEPLLRPWRVSAAEQRRIAQEARKVEVAFELPRLLLVAVVRHESGGQSTIRVDGKRCDTGVAQVRVDCTKVAKMLPLRANLTAAARILAHSRNRCQRPKAPAACGRCRWALYNTYSKSWCESIKATLMELHDKATPSDV